MDETLSKAVQDKFQQINKKAVLSITDKTT